ncbi:polyketide cyclase [Enterovirga sp. DB1703]|uniref:Polyketide cyclase n=1 Tax=Enterovirga aerilata TaxID=2730920 RepID=A0A849I527_9HYPH|nr:polyketide cyclase [Enterovirga sp. DB1703]NNM71157.1 polyketide cyclase [Enterovirga sp. DB1703]
MCRDWCELYERLWRPEAFPEWASGLSEAGLEQDGEVWRARGPEGPVTIRFTGHNPFGIMDHWVELGGGREVYVPLRVIRNGEGCLVTLTLFRWPEMSEDSFAADAAWIERDLQTLKKLAEESRP